MKNYQMQIAHARSHLKFSDRKKSIFIFILTDFQFNHYVWNTQFYKDDFLILLKERIENHIID